MRFNQFSKKLIGDILGTRITESIEFQGKTLAISEDNSIYVDRKLTSFKSLEEAKDAIIRDKLEEELSSDNLENIPDTTVASIIREHHDSIKVTDTLIESYVKMASSKTFSLDPVIREIRNFNTVNLIENKLDFILNDESVVVIDEKTLDKLVDLLDDKYQLIEYMRESKQNFIHVIKELL